MHKTAELNAEQFFKCYKDNFELSKNTKVVEIGSKIVGGGTLRTFCPPEYQYIGLDFDPGEGVDLLLTDPYKYPIEDNSVDIVISSSCFEHSEFFWLSFMEGLRVLKPHGLFYINAPAKGHYHRHPIDSWRFYPDSAVSLANWARRNGTPAVALESYIQDGRIDYWNDFVGVFLKDEAHLDKYPKRILDTKKDYKNGFKHGSPDILNHHHTMEF